ncbi:spore germination protein [Alteribacillus persepolensis]|uniref:Spore germination protein n=1 Tax=Alteribacillus persepolensis TaxID=568899 RepID=A0A1G7ZI70_9BACI|nr:germination protein YpeB [Alteribacillus persepolensis]SDH08305.1 spore germination protein [Alteribacillus persepolensis]
MVKNVLIGVLAAAVIGTGWWGANQASQKEALEINSENNYQRAFHDLSFHLDQIEDEVGSTLAMNSREQLSSSLAQVWRLTSLAQSELGQLPLGLMALNETENLLSKIGDFSYKTTIRDLGEKPLSDQEYEQLQRFYKEAGEIRHDLRKLQASALKEQYKWTEAEQVMADNDAPMDNSIVNGFQTIDNKVKGFKETEFGSEMGQGFAPDVEKKIAESVKGKALSKQEAAKKAKQFLGVPDSMEVEIDELDEESLGFEGYTLTVQEPEGEDEIYMDMTKRGGHPLWFLQSRPIDEPEMSLNEASNKGLAFLEENGYENMELADGKQYDTVGVFQFVTQKDDVKIYPDTVYVEVALDDGEVVGYKASDYIANHHQRDDLSPSISAEEAKAQVNPNVDVQEEGLAVIHNEDDEEILCYEFYGTIENDTFRIYINAEDGDEENVKKMQEAEPVYDTM